MKGATANSKNSWIDNTLLSGPDLMNGPRPWVVPQIARTAITIAEVLTPVVPKRKADHNINGTRK